MKPEVLVTNVLIRSRGKITYPIVTPLGSPIELAVVAVVTGTDTKIEFWIDTVHALKVTTNDLLFTTTWIDDFKTGFKSEQGLNVRGGSKGWTGTILSAALDQYEKFYYMRPSCMVGVFGQTNLEVFWKRFSELYPDREMAVLAPEERAIAAGRAILATPFWKTRKALRYGQLMFEVDALARGEVFVRAFRDGLDVEAIREVAETQKIYPDLEQWNTWVLAPQRLLEEES